MHGSSAFPASPATSLVSGYCKDFIQLAATMAQTLEQVSMRNVDLGASRQDLTRVERGMRDLADAIATLLASHPEQPQPQAPAPARPAATSAATGPSPAATAAPAAPAPARNAGAEPAAGSLAPPPTLPPPPATLPVPLLGDHVTGGRRGECVMHGSSESMPLLSVFQFLGRTRKTGTLAIQFGAENLSFAFEDGCVSGTVSNEPPRNERLGSLLVELGFLTQGTIDSFAPAPTSSARLLGDALVRAGVLTESQLVEALELQVTRRYQRVVGSGKAFQYSFYEGRSRGSHRLLRIRTFEILFSGRRAGR